MVIELHALSSVAFSVTQRQGVDTLGDQFLDGVLDQIRITMVGEAGRKLPNDAGDPLGFTQQQTARVRRDSATVESGHHIPASQRMKSERLLVTLCHHQAVPP